MKIIEIIHAKCEVYDVYEIEDKDSHWIFTTCHADNVFSRLEKMDFDKIRFVDETMMEYEE